MKYTTKKLPHAQLEFTITIEPSEYESHMQHAAKHISEHRKIKGFRPGKAPYEIVKREVGEMAILDEALEKVVQKTLFEALTKEEIETVGGPKVEFEKVAPHNPITYKAVVSLLPDVKLPNFADITIAKKIKPISEEKIQQTIDHLRKLQAAEIVSDKKSTIKDKVVIDLDMLLDGVPVEGGQSKDYAVYLSESHYVPGFNEELVGLKKGDTKEFTLKFPKDHYQKMLAGMNVQFKVTVKEVFEEILPELNDEFAKRLGQTDVAGLHARVKENLQTDEAQKANERYEIALLDNVIDATTFTDIPENLIDSERHKMMHELMQDLERNNISLEQYLQDIKKKENELFEEFKTQAIRRVKAALISRTLARQENMNADETEIDAEIALLKQTYSNNPEYMENLAKAEVRDSIAVVIQNKKVMKWLTENTKTTEETVATDKPTKKTTKKKTTKK